MYSDRKRNSSNYIFVAISNDVDVITARSKTLMIIMITQQSFLLRNTFHSFSFSCKETERNVTKLTGLLRLPNYPIVMKRLARLLAYLPVADMHMDMYIHILRPLVRSVPAFATQTSASCLRVHCSCCYQPFVLRLFTSLLLHCTTLDLHSYAYK